MNATPQPAPAGPVTLGRVVLTEKQIAALAVVVPFGLLVLGVVAVVVLCQRPAARAVESDAPPAAPPQPPAVTPPGESRPGASQPPAADPPSSAPAIPAA